METFVIQLVSCTETSQCDTIANESRVENVHGFCNKRELSSFVSRRAFYTVDTLYHYETLVLISKLYSEFKYQVSFSDKIGSHTAQKQERLYL